MVTWNPLANEIFLKTLDEPSPERRRALVEAACAGDTGLLADVEALMDANDRVGSFLMSTPTMDGARAHGLPANHRLIPEEVPGSMVGPYKLLQQIGEGGMGVVFLAEQTKPVWRQVAIKIIKPGMDSRQVMARFDAERQAIALMDHPNIAKVLDAGSTCTGRPYFVMELVKGVSITQYCDERRLTPRQRIELFLPVCHAVQHAHQKGIIHRDLKPSNVIVALYDGVPVPKVIDFGVAKATGPRLTEQTLYTNLGAIIGTLEYMSPEQAELNQLDVDTRSDVYALGVLLYELLTGTTPLERDRLKKAALLETLRAIREEEPPRPSTRLGTTEKLPSVAEQRGLEPKQLSTTVRGDLDWIVMKALEKDRNRRYESAAGLARDIQRHLNDEPVLARPAGAAYRTRKFVRRHRVMVAAAGVLCASLLLAVGSLGWVLRDRASLRVSMERDLGRALEDVREHHRNRRYADALGALDRADAIRGDRKSSVRAEFDDELSRWRRDLEMVRRLDEIRARKSDPAGFGWAAAEPAYRAAFREYGIDPDAPDRAGVARLIQESAVRDPLIIALDDWLMSNVPAKLAGGDRLLELLSLADADPWRTRLRQAFAARDRAALESIAADPGLAAQPPVTVSMLVLGLRKAGNAQAALDALRAGQRRHPTDFWLTHDMGWLLAKLGPDRQAEAVGFFRAAVSIKPANVTTRNQLAYYLTKVGRVDEGEAFYAQLRAEFPNLPSVHNSSAWGLIMRPGGVTRADGDRAVAYAARADALKPGEYDNTLAAAYYRAGRWQDAMDALERCRKGDGDDKVGSDVALFLAMTHHQLGRDDDARRWLDRGVKIAERDEPDAVQLLAEAERLVRPGNANAR